MSRIILKDVLEDARKKGYAIGQFNFSTLDQLQGIVSAAKELETPVICGTSEGEADFLGLKEAASLVWIMREKEGVPIFLNLDHGGSVERIKEAVDAGYDMVHFDGSKRDFKENMKLTGEVVDYAKEKNLIVEGEVSEISGSSTVSEEILEETTLTPVEKVAKFTESTGVDCVALGVGNVHGVHRGTPSLKKERIREFLDLDERFLVLHGGSGISDEDLKEMVKEGIVKVNVNTELRVAWRKGVEQSLKEKSDEVTPYKILPVARDLVHEKVKEKLEIFGK